MENICVCACKCAHAVCVHVGMCVCALHANVHVLVCVRGCMCICMHVRVCVCRNLGRNLVSFFHNHCCFPMHHLLKRPSFLQDISLVQIRKFEQSVREMWEQSGCPLLLQGLCAFVPAPPCFRYREFKVRRCFTETIGLLTRLFWLFRVFCTSIWVLGLIFLFFKECY